ncbi:LysR substrate-binding domain-containing protein [Desulfovibrio sp.]|uniref:LysR substrate-binding domain-containing protein n=1 Tax=Desulfovibrio sp. TaxID=885 RepID=UPI0025C13687|nr:LysR substrate-binding domain-containing protein [Desulfovibrio sp.]
MTLNVKIQFTNNKSHIKSFLMFTSDDMIFIAALSRSSSLAAAARLLNVTPPAVTQRLRALEARTGVHLVDRGTGEIIFTEEGELLIDASKRILQDIDSVSELLRERKGVVSGQLHIAGPTGFGRRYLAPVIESFSTLHPQVTITLNLSDNPAHLKSDYWDLIIHIGETPTHPFQLVTLAPNKRLLCASPEYLQKHGTPQSPRDLVKHNCLALRENDEDVTMWRFSGPDNNNTAVRITAGLSCNDGDVILEWALSGMGIILRSEWDVADVLARGNLVHLMPDWVSPDAPVVALLGPRRQRTARARFFLESLRQAFDPAPWRSEDEGCGASIPAIAE